MRKLLMFFAVLLLVACQSTPATKPKATNPHLISVVARVQEYQATLQVASAQFQAVQQQLAQSGTAASGTPQERQAAARSEYDKAVEASVAVSTAVDAVKQAAAASFQQWQTEIDALTDVQLKALNQTQLSSTWQSYAGMLHGIRAAERKMNAVLAELGNNVTLLQDNPDAAAMASYPADQKINQSNVEALQRKMKMASDRADEFIVSVQE